MAPKDFIGGVGGTEYTPTQANKEPDSQHPDHDPWDIPGQRQPLKWINIVSIVSVHLVAVAAVLYAPFHASLPTWTFALIWGGMSGLGVTGGAHRLWAHRTYKATFPLRVFLACCFSIAGQNTIPQWVLDHRVHHKFSETDADPHNSNRGFFFAHVGWLMQRKHPQVLARGRQVDLSDLYADPVVVWHTKYFIPLKIFFCFVFPLYVPVYFWNESLTVAACSVIIRYVSSLNSTWLVNSAAHLYGNHPFSTRIMPAENRVVAIMSLGEGWHNYHHVFPWDYKAAEMGHIIFNFTTVFLDVCAKMGLAYEMKSPSKDLVERIAKRFGDGTHHSVDHVHPKEVDENGQEVAETSEADVVVPGDQKTR